MMPYFIQASHSAIHKFPLSAIHCNWCDRGFQLPLHEAVCALQITAVQEVEDRLENPRLPWSISHPGKCNYVLFFIITLYVLQLFCFWIVLILRETISVTFQCKPKGLTSDEHPVVGSWAGGVAQYFQFCNAKLLVQSLRLHAHYHQQIIVMAELHTNIISWTGTVNSVL